MNLANAGWLSNDFAPMPVFWAFGRKNGLTLSPFSHRFFFAPQKGIRPAPADGCRREDLKTKAPVRGRSALTSFPEVSLSLYLFKNKSPRKGTERLSEKDEQLSAMETFKNKSPRKGTERRNIFHDISLYFYLKTKAPVRGRRRKRCIDT